MQKEKQLIIFYLYLYSLSQVFNDINDNQKIKSLCTLSLYTNKVQKYQKEFFTLKIIEKNRQNKIRQMKKDEMKEEHYINYRTVIK